MSNEQIDTAPPDVGAANERSAGARESASLQVGTVAPGDFALALERDGSKTAVLVLAGELDLYRAPAIEEALAEAIGSKLDSDGGHKPLLGVPPTDAQGLEAKVRHLAVDLRLVTFFDSTMLALLLAASRRQHAQGGQLLVLVGPRTPMSAFEMTGFDRLLTIKRLDDDRSTHRRTVGSERIGLSPPPQCLKGRNHDGNSANS